MKGLGTALNVAAVLFGAGIGKALGARLSSAVRETVMDALGLLTLVIGVSLALETRNPLIILGSVLIGGVIGEGLGIESRLERMSDRVRNRLSIRDTTFTEGFVTASLLFCVGPMTIIGSLQDGLRGDYELLAIKSVLDGFAALAFASTLGWGVAFAGVTVLVYQGTLTAVAGLLAGVLSGPSGTELNAVGGLLIAAIGLRLLEVRRVRVGNLLPALFVAPIIVGIVRAMGISLG